MKKIPATVTATVCLLLTGTDYQGNPSYTVCSGTVEEHLDRITSWTPICEASVVFKVPEDRQDTTKLTIEALQRSITKEKAESHLRVLGLSEQINELLALPNLGENNDVV